jgi:hypothetical protein
MLGLLKVELVGDSVWLNLFVALIPAAFLATAAVVAARIARQSALERQKDQLKHETERQKEQLQRETERQKEQLQRETERQKEQLQRETERQKEALRHDQAMRERESSRLVVDQAIETMHSTVPLLTTLEVRIDGIQKAMQEGDEEWLASLQELADEERQKCRETILELQLHDIRLTTRPDTEDLAEPYEAAHMNHSKHLDALEGGIRNELSDEQKAAIKALDKAGTSKWAEVLAAFRDWLADDD